MEFPDSIDLTRPIDKATAAAMLAELSRESSRAFDIIDRDPTKSLVFGFVATLAVAQLSEIAVGEAKKIGSSRLFALDRRSVVAAYRLAKNTARDRYRSEPFGAGIWALIANALMTHILRTDLLEAGEATRATQALSSIQNRIDNCIRLYADATTNELRDANLLDAAVVADPAIGTTGVRHPATDTASGSSPSRAERRSVDPKILLVGLLGIFVGLIVGAGAALVDGHDLSLPQDPTLLILILIVFFAGIGIATIRSSRPDLRPLEDYAPEIDDSTRLIPRDAELSLREERHREEMRVLAGAFGWVLGLISVIVVFLA